MKPPPPIPKDYKIWKWTWPPGVKKKKAKPRQWLRSSKQFLGLIAVAGVVVVGVKTIPAWVTQRAVHAALLRIAGELTKRAGRTIKKAALHDIIGREAEDAAIVVAEYQASRRGLGRFINLNRIASNFQGLDLMSQDGMMQVKARGYGVRIPI